jgi:Tfp pilus assembly protein PilX
VIPLRLYLYVAAVLAILGALWGYGHHQKQQGRDEVQTKFDAYIAQQTADTLQASLANQETSLLKQRAADRSRLNDYENTKRLAAANAGLRGANASLHDTIAALNSPTQAGDTTQASAGTDDASKTARDLLGKCSSRYSELAGEAGELAKQVIGLQGFLLAIEESAAP